MNGWMAGQMDRRMAGRTDSRMAGRTDRQEQLTTKLLWPCDQGVICNFSVGTCYCSIMRTYCQCSRIPLFMQTLMESSRLFSCFCHKQQVECYKYRCVCDSQLSCLTVNKCKEEIGRQLARHTSARCSPLIKAQMVHFGGNDRSYWEDVCVMNLHFPLLHSVICRLKVGKFHLSIHNLI